MEAESGSPSPQPVITPAEDDLHADAVEEVQEVTDTAPAANTGSPPPVDAPVEPADPAEPAQEAAPVCTAAAASDGEENEIVTAAMPADASNEEDSFKAISRQLSRLSIPDAPAPGAPGECADSDAEEEGHGAAAALAGLEELPAELSPSKARFSQTTEPSAELFERLALSGADALGSPPPEGYYPRSKSVSPVQRKIAQMEAEAWAGIPFDPKPTPTRLERELGGFADFRRNEQSAPDWARRSNGSSNAASPRARASSQDESGGPARSGSAGGGPTPEAMSEMLQRHKEKQERLREKAAARSPERSPLPPRSSQVLIEQQAEVWGGESLEALIVPSKSRLQMEKEAALAADASGGDGAPTVDAAAFGDELDGDEFAGMSLEELEAALAEAEAEAAAAMAAAEAGSGGYVTAAAAFAGSTLDDLKKRKSRRVVGLERERDAALAAAAPRMAARSTIPTATGGPSLEEGLVQRKSRLEQEREAALAAAVPRVGARSALSSAQEEQPALELVQRKSKLEQEREAALAAAAPRIAARSASSSAHEEQPALDLVQRKSRLEQERDAALAAAAPRTAARSPLVSAAEEQPALEDFVRRKSKLEQEREAALAAGEPRTAARSSRTSTQEGESSQGALGEGAVLRKSKLELELEAAKAAAAATGAYEVRADGASRRTSSSGHETSLADALGGPKRLSRLEQEKAAAKAAAENAVPGGAAGAAPKSRLQLEKDAVAKAEKARAAAALLAKARAAAAAKAGSLSEALRPTPPSKLQQEGEAWRRADA